MSLDTTKAVRFKGKVSNWVNSFPASAKMLTIDANGDVAYQDIPTASFASLSGLPSDNAALQSVLNSKAPFSHTHEIANISGLQSALDGKASSSHTHTIGDTTGLQSALDGKAPFSHIHIIGDVTGLQSALDGKAPTSHTHTIGDVTGLQAALDGKANTSSLANYLPLAGGTLTGGLSGTTISASGEIRSSDIGRSSGNRISIANQLWQFSMNGSDEISFTQQGGTDSWGVCTRLGGFAAGALPYGDVKWVRDAANIWAQRNGVNSQTWRLYNTFTDTGNYIRQAQSFTTFSSTVHAQWLAEGLGTGAVNIPMVISPRGTGAFILGPMPDGTATGGNARGANAVDLQLSRSAATQVASGPGSFTAGGGCTASGSSCVAIGLFSTASGGNSCFVFGDYATASGEYSFSFGRGTSSGWHSFGFGRGFLSNRSGQFSFANGSFSTGGDAQNTKFVARCTTSGTTPGNLLLGTSWGASATDRISINSGEVFGFLINIIGSKSDGSAVTHYVRKGAIKRVSNTTTLAYVETVGTDYEDNAATDVSITADDTNDALQISVTGIAGETWRWVATIEAADLGFGT